MSSKHDDWDFETFQWAGAIDQVTAEGKKSALVKRLRSDAPISPKARELLASLIQQMHAPAAPTERDWNMLDAAEEFWEAKEILPKGPERDDAETRLLAEIARKHNVTPIKKTKDEDLVAEDADEVARDYALNPRAAALDQLAKDRRDAVALRNFVVFQKGGTYKRLRHVKRSPNDL